MRVIYVAFRFPLAYMDQTGCCGVVSTVSRQRMDHACAVVKFGMAGVQGYHGLLGRTLHSLAHVAIRASQPWTLSECSLMLSRKHKCKKGEIKLQGGRQ